MARFVPYLSEDQIERDAAALLAEFAQARGVVIVPPIPIEDIVEKHLKLGVEFNDTHRLFGVPRSGLGFDPDILGAMFFDERRIVIDQGLDPEENPSKEGRYRFTLAHEGGGHWRLHRHLFAKDPAQISLFNEPAPPSVICRSSQKKEPVEWQADFYASCLLMPRKLIMAAWDEIFPDRRPHIMNRTNRDLVAAISDAEGRDFELKVEEWQNKQAMEDFARPLAQQFLVSSEAMSIRLQTLGLLLSEVPRQRMFNGCS
jgi:Zn-dependent peptidase ImmA (M78 family)